MADFQTVSFWMQELIQQSTVTANNPCSHKTPNCDHSLVCSWVGGGQVQSMTLKELDYAPPPK